MNRTPLATEAMEAPAWVDLGTRAGTAVAARFYCGLFGWSVVARHRPLEDSVGYWTFQQDGRAVGGLAPGRDASWTVYMSVTDVDATVRAVTDNGGAVLVGPMTDADARRTALCADPSGATFAIWQPVPSAWGGGRREHRSEQSGASMWYQLACRDVDEAKRFYASVFGWEAETTLCADGSTYTELFHPETDRRVAGIVQMDERWDADMSPRWMNHFSVSDTDRSVARAAELGGHVSVAPFDLPDVGRIAVLNDPESTVFSVRQAA